MTRPVIVFTLIVIIIGLLVWGTCSMRIAREPPAPGSQSGLQDGSVRGPGSGGGGQSGSW